MYPWDEVPIPQGFIQDRGNFLGCLVEVFCVHRWLCGEYNVTVDVRNEKGAGEEGEPPTPEFNPGELVLAWEGANQGHVP